MGGCVPLRYGPYLRPSYPDPSSTRTRAFCGGRAGPPVTVAFSAPGGVEVTVSTQPAASRGGEDDWLTHISVKPRANSSFRFLARTVSTGDAAERLNEAATPEVSASALQRVAATAWVDIAALGPTGSEAALNASLGGSAIAEVGIGFGTIPGAPGQLRVVLPSIETRRGRFAAPPEELTAEAPDFGFRTLRSWHYADTLSQRESQCAAQPSEPGCAAMIRLDRTSFRSEVGPFTYAGRFWSVLDQSPELTRFELTVHARTAEPWRLVEPIVRTTDPSTGETRELPFADMHVSLRYPVPLDTELHGAAPALSITIAISHPHPRRFIQLPPYEVDGGRHEFKPIELELRREDGGFAPFNC